VRRALALAAVAALAAGAARAQDPHAGHNMPAPAKPAPKAAAKPAPKAAPKPKPRPAPKPAAPKAAPADPHAGHDMPAQAPPAPQPAAPADPHAGHQMPAPAPAPGAATEPPPIPSDFDADRYFPKAAMDAARARLAAEHGRFAWSKVMIDQLELRPGSPDGYAWEGKASFGRDIHRFVVKSRGEGERKLETAEVEALWSRAISPWFDIQAGLRQDLQKRGRTYATVGVDGLAPYEFDLDAALYLSSHGDLSARVEATHDFRVTQRLILQPRAEADLAASTVRLQGIGAGLSSVELGLRLRYAVTPEFAPYIGVEHERAFGRTARLLRAADEETRDTRFVVGLRAWF
jgi:copper resistance protein B